MSTSLPSRRDDRAPARPVATWRDRTAAVLLVVAAIGAVYGTVASAGAVADAAPDARVVETWHMLGLAVFAGLFLLLAWRPRAYAGVWELSIANKLALWLLGVTYLRGGEGTGDLAVDGVLAVVLLVAYALTRAWTAWARVRAAGRSG